MGWNNGRIKRPLAALCTPGNSGVYGYFESSNSGLNGDGVQLMKTNQALNTLPVDIQRDWMATLDRQPIEAGHFYLTDIRRTGARDFQSQRITVIVVDENGFPLPNVRVAFSYSTADQYFITPDFAWTPPAPPRAFIVPTQGSGQCDQIQGSSVKQGQPGGVTVYVLEPEYSSDVVAGLGMLADHTGLVLTFQLRRAGVVSFQEQLDGLSNRVRMLEGAGNRQ